MALTLAEAAKLSNDMLLQGVVETIVKESPVLKELPFIEIVGNGLTYNQENKNKEHFAIVKNIPGLLCFSHSTLSHILSMPPIFVLIKN